MEFDRDAILRKMLTLAPRCIREFIVEATERPESWEGLDVAAWKLRCHCGGGSGQFLGYPLKRYNSTYTGDAFVGPLGWRCSNCGKLTEILDTDLHGYHAEIGSSSCIIRGEGTRLPFECSNCTGRQFETLVSFVYWPAAVDLLEDNVIDETYEFVGKPEDLFNEFVAHGRCSGCGCLMRFTDFGKL